MKKQLLTVMSLMLTTALIAQTPLTKTSFVNEEVEFVHAFQGNSNISYATENELFVVNTENGNIVSNFAVNNLNNIYENGIAFGDTSAISGEYSGNIYGEVFHNGSSIGNVGMPVRDLAESEDWIYTILKSGADYLIASIWKPGNMFSYKNISSDLAQNDSIGSGYKRLQYLSYAGEDYLIIYGFTYNNQESHVIVRVSNSITPNTPPIQNESINSSFNNQNNGCYISQGNQIRKVNGIGGGPSNFWLSLETDYITPTLINDISFNNHNIDSTGMNFKIYAACEDGLYSNDVTLDITEQEKNKKVEVYPNPFNSKVNLQGIDSNQPYIISDLSGKIVDSGLTKSTLSLAHLENGMYVLKIEGYEVKRIVKK